MVSTVSLKDAEAGLSALMDRAGAGEFVTITRPGKSAAVLVSLDAAEAAKHAVEPSERSFATHLLSFPETDQDVLARNGSGSRDLDQ